MYVTSATSTHQSTAWCQGATCVENLEMLCNLTAVVEMSDNWSQVMGVSGENLVQENCLLQSLHSGLCWCLVVSRMHAYTVKYGVGNRNLGGSATKNWGDV